jgi:hypothetical protein
MPLAFRTFKFLKMMKKAGKEMIEEEKASEAGKK